MRRIEGIREYVKESWSECSSPVATEDATAIEADRMQGGAEVTVLIKSVNVGRTDGAAAHNIKVVYDCPEKSFFSYNLETKEYVIYISEKEANPEAVIKRALEEIERREGLVSA